MTLLKTIGKNHKIVWEKKKRMDLLMSFLAIFACTAFVAIVALTAAILQINIPLGVFINCTLLVMFTILAVLFQKREQVYAISLLYKDKTVYRYFEVQATSDYLTDRNGVANVVRMFEIIAKVREAQEKELPPTDDRDQKIFEGL
jgi:hypothetical protein